MSVNVAVPPLRSAGGSPAAGFSITLPTIVTRKRIGVPSGMFWPWTVTAMLLQRSTHEPLEILPRRCHAFGMKTTLDLKPAALKAVRAVSKREKISVDDAASSLILRAVAEAHAKTRLRHGIPLARNDGVAMTAEEVAATLNDG